MHRTTTCLSLVLLLTSQAAALVNVTNPSFEDISGETVSNEFTFGAFNGWSLYEGPGGISGGMLIGTLTPQPDPGNPGDFINFPGGASDGDRVAIAFNFENTGDTVEYGLEQTNAGTIEANMSYTLQVDIGNIASGQSQANGYFNLDGMPPYRIALLANGVEIADDNGVLTGTIAEGGWATASVTYTALAGDPNIGATLGIRLVNENITDNGETTFVPIGNDIEVDFDNVRLSETAVPEPSTLALLFGLGTLVAVSRQR